jgi:hypothetical protein
MDPYLTSPRILRWFVAVGVAVSAAGCAVVQPSNPTIMALPAKGKSLNEFQQDDYGCRAYASQVVNPAANSHQAQSAGSAAPATGTTQHKQTEASLQQQYNNAYAQCITAKGDTIGMPRPVPAMVRVPAVIYAPPPYYYVPY